MIARVELTRIMDLLEQERVELLNRLDQRPPDALAIAPGPGQWSVAQVVLHLATIEESALRYLRKKLEVKGHGPAGHGSSWRLMLLNVAMWLPIKFKAPPVVARTPVCSYAEARERWCAQRTEMLKTYAELPDALITHGLFKHPTAGKLNVVQSLRFVRQHMLRHRRQIDRALQQVSA